MQPLLQLPLLELHLFVGRDGPEVTGGRRGESAAERTISHPNPRVAALFFFPSFLGTVVSTPY